MMNSKIIYPPHLKAGDTIAIISPATSVKPEYIEGAVARLKSYGLDVKVMPSAFGPSDGSYASTRDNRLNDLRAALTDSSIKAILCARGGYGAVHLIDEISEDEIARNPKWLIGYSDISALHAMMQRVGVASVHAPMAKHLSIESEGDCAVAELMKLLTSGLPLHYEVKGYRYNRPGVASGVLRGGNLAVLEGLIGTEYDLLNVADGEDVILFVEDIGEAIYRTERMMWHLHLRGDLERVKGLIIGQFTESKSDSNFASTYDMIDSLLRQFGLNDLPVAFDFPVGHVRENLPMVEGAYATLEVSADKVVLIQNEIKQ